MTTNIRNNRQAASTPQRRFGTTAIVLSCVLLVTGGFFVAARQHFASMDFGMKNSRLRRQVDQLEAEKRRLLLAREVSLSPAEIKKDVKKVGIGDPAREPIVATTASTSTVRPSNLPAVSKPLVERTVSVQPTKTVVAPASRLEKADRFSKKGTEAE